MVRSRHNLLIVDDEPDNLDLLERAFRKKYQVFRAPSGQAALEILQSQDVDLMITDFRMPEMNGVQLMERARDINPHVVRIVLSGYSDPSEIIAAVNRGEAYRYLTKPFILAELLLLVAQALESYDMRRERDVMLSQLLRQNAALQATQAELQLLNATLEGRIAERTRELTETNTRLEAALEQVTHLVRTDAATGLWNRRHFQQAGSVELERAGRYKTDLSVLVMRLQVTCAAPLSHASTDWLFSTVSRLLQTNLRGIDVVARLNDEHLAALLPLVGTTQAQETSSRLQKVVRALDLEPVLGRDHRIDVLVGAATYPRDANDLEGLIDRATANSPSFPTAS